MDGQEGRGGSPNDHVNPQGGGGSEVLIHMDFLEVQIDVNKCKYETILNQ